MGCLELLRVKDARKNRNIIIWLGRQYESYEMKKFGWQPARKGIRRICVCMYMDVNIFYLVVCINVGGVRGNLVNTLVCLSISRFLSVISPSCYQKAFWYFDFLIFLCGICSVFVSFYMCTECVLLQKYSCFCSKTFLLYRFANLKLCILWINAFRVGLNIIKI